MKVQGKVQQTQRIEGNITPADLLALVRETFIIPEGAEATFHIIDTGLRPGLIQAQMGWQASPVVQIGETNPVKFVITWSLPNGPSEQG